MAELAAVIGRLLGQVAVTVAVLWLVAPVPPLAAPVPALRAGSPLKIDLAVATLRQADRLYAAQVGYAGLAPAELLAWRLIAHAPARDSLFLALTRSPSRVAQLYGLIGLHASSRDLYRPVASALARDGSTVPVMVGCEAGDQPMPTVLAEIERGVWSREFLTGRLLR